MVGTSQMAATAVVLIALGISWTPTGIAMAAPAEQRLDERAEDRMALLELRMAQLVISLRVDELIRKMEAVLRKLDENSPTTSDTQSRVLRAVEAASITSIRIEKGLAKLEARLEGTEERLSRMEEKIEEKLVRMEKRTEEGLERLGERMTHLVTSLKVELEGRSPTTSDSPPSGLPPVEAASTSPGTATTPITPMTSEKSKALGEALCKAALEGRARDVEKLLQEGADVDYHKADFYNRTALHVAAEKGHVDVVALLIAAGADANIRDDLYQSTPLHVAAYFGKDAAVQKLIDAGADLNTQTIHGNTPLHVAADWGKEATVQKLIDAGADLNIQNVNGGTPLHYAAQHGDVAAAQALIAASSELNRQDKYGGTPLHYAASNGHKEVVKALIAAGARKDILNNDGKTPYDFAHPSVRDLLQP